MKASTAMMASVLELDWPRNVNRPRNDMNRILWEIGGKGKRDEGRRLAPALPSDPA
jgi:hypothetical protein